MEPGRRQRTQPSLCDIGTDLPPLGGLEGVGNSGKSFYHASMRVDWEHIIVESERRLGSVVHAVERRPHIGCYTRHLDLRIETRYNLALLLNLLRTMTDLKVFVVGQLGPTSREPPALQTIILKTLASTAPMIERLMFSGRGEPLTLKHTSLIHRIFSHLPSLQFNDLADSPPGAKVVAKRFAFPQLTTLFIGVRYRMSPSTDAT